MPPGYRRRILIEPAPGIVTAELEDDYHRMVVTLHHRDDVITEATSEMKRAPWTLCPGAMDRLSETFTGVALTDAARRGEKTQNCTHLHDLALFAAAHAGTQQPVAYDILVTDSIDGARNARLIRNGVLLLDWTLAGDRFLAPAEFDGRTLRDLGDWIARQDEAMAEATRILRWASIIAYGRGMDIPAGIAATAFPGGTCYNFQPERAASSTRRAGADVDFSIAGREPLADRARSFAGTGRLRMKVIVTGAFGALGRAVVSDLAARGHAVAAVDLAEQSADQDDIVAIPGVDLADESAVATAFAEAVAKLGGLDGLVNIAGGFVWEPIEGGSIDSWDRMYRINLRTAAIASRAAMPHLLDAGGAIVNVGAAGAMRPGKGMAPYAASKAGVRALTESLAEELRDRGVRVNAVLPTIIDTPINRADMPDADRSGWVRPEAAAAAIAFLLSDEARAITGASVPLSLAG